MSPGAFFMSDIVPAREFRAHSEAANSQDSHFGTEAVEDRSGRDNEMKGNAMARAIRIAAFSASLMLVFAGPPSRGEDSVKNSPFSYGEDMPDRVASCEDIRAWADKAPNTDARISLAIRGALSRVRGDSALAYLTMCAAPHPEVVCVTYSRNGMSTGDVVTFAGGYRRLDTNRIVLDPCLASRR